MSWQLKTSYRSAINPHRILVSGANGFLGRALVNRGASEGLRLRAATRRPVENWPSGVESALTEDLAVEGDWRAALDSVDTVVNCAARVHVMHNTSADPLAEFRRINVAGTLNLARQAADVGVRRFVHISSIGVNGAETFEKPFTAEDKAAPHSPYAVSKHEAELGLRQLAQETGLEVVIIRPPLVFGPGAPGNFNKLLLIVYRGIPLPLGAIHNKRSLVALDNLVDLIVARLIPLPAVVLRTAALPLGKAGFAQQLCGSLQVDISKTRALLGWTPPVSVDDALTQAARHFLANRPS